MPFSRGHYYCRELCRQNSGSRFLASSVEHGCRRKQAVIRRSTSSRVCFYELCLRSIAKHNRTRLQAEALNTRGESGHTSELSNWKMGTKCNDRPLAANKPRQRQGSGRSDTGARASVHSILEPRLKIVRRGVLLVLQLAYMPGGDSPHRCH